MKEIRWSRLKSERLKRTRGVSFKELLGSELVDIIRHPGRDNQNMFLFKYKGYVWAVPYVKAADHLFLKTLFPSRKYTKLYNRGDMP